METEVGPAIDLLYSFVHRKLRELGVDWPYTESLTAIPLPKGALYYVQLNEKDDDLTSDYVFVIKRESELTISFRLFAELICGENTRTMINDVAKLANYGLHRFSKELAESVKKKEIKLESSYTLLLKQVIACFSCPAIDLGVEEPTVLIEEDIMGLEVSFLMKR